MQCLLNIAISLRSREHNRLSQHTEDRDLEKMRRWRNSFQKKEQEKVTARNLIETDLSKMPEPEFKTTIVRILAGLDKSINNTRESLTTEIKKPKN